jgi:V-type H+-transporting ATPase subunit E
MTAFIKQEAMEKAREIEIKANEEFEIEKSKLVRQETDAIDATYEKKFKQATMSQQITRSTVANKTRLKVLGARQQVLDNIYEDARKQLSNGTKDKAKYQKVLKGLILEGLYAMNESDVDIRCRKADNDVVKKAIDEACKEYKKEEGKEVKATIDEENALPEGKYVSETWIVRKCLESIANVFSFVVLAVSPLLEDEARLKSTTPLRLVWHFWRSRLDQRFVKHCLERTPTANSTIRPVTCYFRCLRA